MPSRTDAPRPTPWPKRWTRIDAVSDTGVTPRRALFRTSAVIELLFGAALLAFPGRMLTLLLGPQGTSISPSAARLLGIALAGLGLWAIERRSAPTDPASRLGLCAYNLLAATGLVVLGASGRGSGILLWPAAALHAVIGAAMLSVLRPLRSTRSRSRHG